MDDREALQLLLLDDADEPIELRLRDEPDPAIRRLMQTLGVRVAITPDGLSRKDDLDVRTVTLCAEPLCKKEALSGAPKCRYHTPIGEIRALRENGSAALDRMDAGEPQMNGHAPVAEQPSPPQPSRSGVRNRWNPYTRDELIQLLRGAAESLGRAPVTRDLASKGLPSQKTLVQMFGSFNEALEAAGLDARPQNGSGRAAARPEPAAGSAASPEPPADPPRDPVLAPASETTAARPETPSVALAEPDQGRGESRSEATPVTASESSGSASADGGGFTLALTGDFARDAQRCRDEAALLRRQAGALDRIADGIDQLEAA